MKKFVEEFKAFALRGNMMDMAVGVIIGGGFIGIVTSLTDNFINPILNLVMRTEIYTLRDLVNFLILAFVLFCLIKGINKLAELGQKKQETASPATKKCPYCLSDIPVQATRCPHCTSVLADKAEAGEKA